MAFFLNNHLRSMWWWKQQWNVCNYALIYASNLCCLAWRRLKSLSHTRNICSAVSPCRLGKYWLRLRLKKRIKMFYPACFFCFFSPVFFKVKCVIIVPRQHTLAYEMKRHVIAQKWAVHHGNDGKIRLQILLSPHGRGGDHLRQWAQHLIDKVN